jgi:hypothetical protein
MDIEKEKCQVCGRTAKNYQFAMFICERDECVRQAMEERGGPAGHMKAKAKAAAKKAAKKEKK